MNLPDIDFKVEMDNLQIGMIGLQDVHIAPSKDDWHDFEENIFAKIRSSVSLDDIKDDPIFRSYRDLYWSFGMDPTKLRVSSEALLRRIVNGNNLWRISNIVDVVNLASPYHKLPIGLVDVSKIDGSLEIRVAKKGELFTRIGGKTVQCRGREIVLADQEKIVCFGYATHDSEQTKVSAESEEVLVLLYGAPEVSTDYLETSTYDTLVMLKKWVDCEPTGTKFINC